jgi:predicted acetyltransferase
MNDIRLIRPTIDLKDEYLSFYQEWKESEEKIIPWVISKDPTDFEGMVQSILNNESNINLPDGWVPNSTFWLVDQKERILGVVNIRHRLTEKLQKLEATSGTG